ncbi:myosin-4-like isoform X2 [Halichondria panicea]|uniref:myosin-4-like isoform X2 n=1 Tax=Halichondria panicea TaxID=6063 RepID=UPI00312B4ACE
MSSCSTVYLNGVCSTGMARRQSHYKVSSTYTDNSDSTCSEIELKSGRGMSSDRRQYLHHQVDDLCDDLSKGNCTMLENERLMSHFQENSLRKDLDQSRELLRQSSMPHIPYQSEHHSPTLCNCYQQSISNDVERERLARERSDTEKLRMMDLLNTSLSRSTAASIADPLLQGISSDVMCLKSEVMEAQLGVNKSKATTASMESRIRNIEKKVEEASSHGINARQLNEVAEEIRTIKDDLERSDANQKTLKLQTLESELGNERDRHSVSRLEVERLSNDLYRLGEELKNTQQNKRKVACCLKATSHKLDSSMSSKEILMGEIQDVRHQLTLSEEARLLCESKNGSLMDKLSKQEMGQHLFKEKLQRVENRIQNNEEERSMMAAKIEELGSLLASSQAAESQWRDCCDRLEAQILEMSSHSEMLASVRRQLMDVEEECSRMMQKLGHLTGEQEAAHQERTTLLSKISELESTVCQSEGECSRLREEAQGLSAQLQASHQEKSVVVEQGGEGLDRIKSLQEQNKQLNIQISELESRAEQQLLTCLNEQAANSQMLQKYKARCKKLLQERVRFGEDFVRLKNDCKCKELEDQLIQCQAYIEADRDGSLMLKHENNGLKSKCLASCKKLKQLSDKCQTLESLSAELQASEESQMHSKVKCEEELCALQAYNESLMLKNTSLQQKLCKVIGEASTLSKQLETVRAENMKISKNFTAENSVLSKKQNKLTQLCKSLKTEVASLQSECSQLRSNKNKNATKLQKVEQACQFREKELHQEMETLKVSLQVELDSLVHEHNRVVSNLKQEITQLQVRLSDEQSTVRAVRLQQRKALEGQQRLVEEDLSRSLKDSERVKHKYSKTKKYLQDKVFQLQRRLDDTKCEETLRLDYRSPYQDSLATATEDHNELLKALSIEVDIVVRKLSARVDIPEFLTMPADTGSDTKALFAELLTKTQWLKKEVVQLLAHEEQLCVLLDRKQCNKVGNANRLCDSSHSISRKSSLQLEHL